MEKTLEYNLMQAAKLSGFKIYDENEYIATVNYQLNHGQIHFIEINGNVAGFFGWLIKKNDEGIGICINNLFILEKYKNKFNIFDMCKFFKNKYPDAYVLEWHNQKKDEFKKLILKGRKI